MKKAHEYLEVFDLEGNPLGEQERGEFFKETREEFRTKGKVSRQVKSIRLLLMNNEGRVYLQKRSKIKGENAGLYDKSVGGHVYRGHSFDVTVTKECAEELGFPAAVLNSTDFGKAIRNTDLDIVGLFKEVGIENNYESMRLLNDGSVFIQPYISAFYVGYFNGPIRFVDGEASGIETYSFEELEAELKANPMKYTKDLKYMFDKYKQYLKPLKATKK